MTGADGEGVSAISAKWPEPERVYRRAAVKGLALGTIQLVQVGPTAWVANMVAQHGHASPEHPVAVRYDALATCLGALAREATALDAEVQMPRIGMGLGGGSWDKIEPMLVELAASVSVSVFDLPTKRHGSG
jgi:O-acetyl-ADP-ribose deacetylase (regulator of RNase III)